MAADPARVTSLFLAAAELDDPAQRAAFLDRECQGDLELRNRVEALLHAHDPAGTATADLRPEPDATAETTTDFQTETPPPVVIADRYTLLKKIGEGGMGEVWVAQQTEPVKRKVALKLIRSGKDSRAVIQRFEQERQALAVMDHPNIARILDGGMTAGGQPFFVMELVDGQPLTKFCDEQKLTPKERLELFVPICQAVQHAHQKGIIHRDLKPANILVTVIDGRPVPKVIDFGVAKATAGKLIDDSISTQFGTIVGTLEYMSPEQAGVSDGDIDTRADIYALGIILYELLTGLRPIDAHRLRQAALDEIIRIIREEEPSRPSTRLSTNDALPSQAALRQTDPSGLLRLLRGDLDWVVMKCLEKSRDRRYETANGLARDIERFLSNEPVEARPPSTWYRSRKFVRRHRPAVIAAAGFALALVMAGIFLIRERDQAAMRAIQRVKLQTQAARIRQQSLRADLDRGRATLRFGDWKGTIQALDSALTRANQYPDDPDSKSLVLGSATFWLDRIRAFDGLNDPKNARDNLENLRGRIDRGEIVPSPMEAGEILIRRADLDPSGEPGTSTKSLMEEALKGPLRPELESYARGYLAPTAVEAAQHFEAAWRNDPYLYRARLNQVFALFLMGDFETAYKITAVTQEIYPDDPNMKVALCLLLACLGRFEEAATTSETLRVPGQEPYYDLAGTMIDILKDRGQKSTSPGISQVMKLVLQYGKVWETSMFSAQPIYIDEYKNAIAAGAPFELRALLGNLNPFVSESARRKALERAETIIPHGPLASSLLFKLYWDSGDWKRLEPLALDILQRPPGPLSMPRSEAAGLLILSFLQRFLATPGPGESGLIRLIPLAILEGVRVLPDADLRARASRSLRACLGVPEISEFYIIEMSVICWFTGDFETSRLFLIEGLTRFPNSEGIRSRLVEIQAAEGDPEAILRVAAARERADAQDPFVPKLRAKAHARLAEIQRAIEEAERPAPKPPGEPPPAN